MAELGFRKLDDMIGQTQTARVRRRVEPLEGQAPGPVGDPAQARSRCSATYQLRNVEKQDHGLERLARQHEADPARQGRARARREGLRPSCRSRTPTARSARRSPARSRKKYGHTGLPDDTITFKFNGSAGQSFGCFLARGITLLLEGDANDYVGKGLSGGRIAVFPPKDALDRASRPSRTSSPATRSATARSRARSTSAAWSASGSASATPARARSSKACGDHGCEYMTGGRVVVIGPTGRNFAAGMSGGIAYVYDDDGAVHRALQPGHGRAREARTQPDEDVATIQRLLENHVKFTDSPIAKAILDDWESELALLRQGDAERLPPRAGRAGRDRGPSRGARPLPEPRTATADGDGDGDAAAAETLVNAGVRKGGSDVGSGNRG